MANPAHESHKILITDVGTYFGKKLAEKLVEEGFDVFGSGSHEPGEKLLSSANFTFLDIDLSQPLPDHIPTFRTIVHLLRENMDNPTKASLSTVSKKLMSQASQNTNVILAASIKSSEALSSSLEQYQQDSLTAIAIGHIYGPGMNLYPKHTIEPGESFFENNELISLISQAAETDKIILNNDGLDPIYPTFVDDATEALFKVITSERQHKNLKSIVSSSAQSTLTVAYEIQNKTRAILNKELNLYFLGPQSLERPEQTAQYQVHNNIAHTKTPLPEGLARALISYKEKAGQKLEIKRHSVNKPVLNLNIEKNALKNEPKSKSRKLNISPRILYSSNFRKALFLVALLLFFQLTRTIVNVNSGVSDLRGAQAALSSAKFEEASNKSQSANKHFSSARKSTSLLLKPLSFFEGPKGTLSALEGLEVTSISLDHFAQGTKMLTASLSSVTSGNNQSFPLNNEEATSSLNKAYFESQYALTLMVKSTNSPVFRSKFQQAQKDLARFTELTQTASELSNITPNIVGGKESITYLVILMNNMELRPGGGFIGNFAEVNFKDNKLESIEVEDIYNIDGQLQEVITPPYPLTEKLGVKQLYLRDSNWSADFGVNAQTIRDFYKKETGKTVDGVVALDLTLVEKLLEKMGPVRLADYNEEITSANLFERGQYHSEVGFFPGSTQKKDFFSSLTNATVAKIIDGLTSLGKEDNSAPSMALVETLAQGLREKHLLLAFDNQDINDIVENKNWSNTIPPTIYNPAENIGSTRDFLMINEANVGANKVNRYLKREINYDMTIGRDADLMATLTITYKNESPAETWPGGTYVNYLRTLAPLNSSLEEYREDGKKIDLKQTVRGQSIETVEANQAGELTQFSKLIEVPVKSTKSFTFKYRIPKNIKLETAPLYELYISKQPGTLSDPIKINFNLPAYLKVDSVDGKEDDKNKQNIEITGDLTVDRHYAVKISKK